jgi:hypothetical protein
VELKQCDRCGATERPHRDWGKAAVTTYGGTTSATYDLCPRCVSEVRTFLTPREALEGTA